jgi:hypothetical protein
VLLGNDSNLIKLYQDRRRVDVIKLLWRAVMVQQYPMLSTEVKHYDCLFRDTYIRIFVISEGMTMNEQVSFCFKIPSHVGLQ